MYENSEEIKQVYANLIAEFGIDGQIDKAVEEMGELITVLMQHRNKGVAITEVQDEIIDAFHMVNQLMIFYGITQEMVEEKFKKSTEEFWI